ncbi:hypothetical protein HUJ05_012899 [Dendroctonus ponderosae]|nr:hypothetical protein HUJ05_012899 [Dendroctonus ponderosae]
MARHLLLSSGVWQVVYEDQPDNQGRILRLAIAAATGSLIFNVTTAHLQVEVNDVALADFEFDNDKAVYRDALQSGNFFWEKITVPAETVIDGENVLSLRVTRGSIITHVSPQNTPESEYRTLLVSEKWFQQTKQLDQGKGYSKAPTWLVRETASPPFKGLATAIFTEPFGRPLSTWTAVSRGARLTSILSTANNRSPGINLPSACATPPGTRERMTITVS